MIDDTCRSLVAPKIMRFLTSFFLPKLIRTNQIYEYLWLLEPLSPNINFLIIWFLLAMNSLLITTCLLALCCSQIWAQDDYCFGKDDARPQTRHFTSKTAYQIIKSSNIEKQYQVPGCTAQKIWIFHRHGTRLPSKGTIQKAPRLEQVSWDLKVDRMVLIVSNTG